MFTSAYLQRKKNGIAVLSMILTLLFISLLNVSFSIRKLRICFVGEAHTFKKSFKKWRTCVVICLLDDLSTDVI